MKTTQEMIKYLTERCYWMDKSICGQYRLFFGIKNDQTNSELIYEDPASEDLEDLDSAAYIFYNYVTNDGSNVKTQINKLVHGTTHNIWGQVGTKSEIRKAITCKVWSENPDGIDIEIRGMRLHLNAHWSCSGKTCLYSVDITDEQAGVLGVNMGVYKYFHQASLMIQPDMTVEVQTSARKTEGSQWKYRGSTRIAEAEVTIL